MKTYYLNFHEHLILKENPMIIRVLEDILKDPINEIHRERIIESLMFRRKELAELKTKIEDMKSCYVF